jgi:hypothetical protein
VSSVPPVNPGQKKARREGRAIARISDSYME